jgi:hypothetical protein
MDSDWNTSAVGEAGVLNLVGDDRNNMNENIKPPLVRERRQIKKKGPISSHPLAILYGVIVTRTTNTNKIAVHSTKVCKGS